MNTEQMDEIAPGMEALKIDDRPIRIIGYIVLFVTFGIFGLWSILAPIDGSALAPGVVEVKSHRKTVQHLEGGIVKEIHAKDGDLVKAGDILLILDDTQDRAQLEMVKGQHLALLAQQARLVAEREKATQIKFSEKLADTSDYRNAEAKHTQQQIFDARINSYKGEISVLKQRINQLKSKVSGLTQQRTSNQTMMTSYNEEIKDLKELLAEGFADKQRLRDIQRNHASVQGKIAELTAEIASSQMQIGETKLQVLQIEKEFQENVVGELSDINTKLYDSEERLRALNDSVVRTEIKAPVSGRVMGLKVHTEGGVVKPSESILEIVPQKEDLIIIAQVAPLDIDRVGVGMVADVRFSAFKQALTPVVEGTVMTISADRLIDEVTGNPYFSAQVELTAESIKKLEAFELIPGMPAEVLINTGERTLFEYLTQPVSNAFARAFIED